MANYYDILKVSPKASRAEIKSAYRRLARKLHPDKNLGSEETARSFAAIAEAYEVLSNAEYRAEYDKKLLMAQYSNASSDSLFTSSNVHAKRWRQMLYDRRYNEIIDRMMAEERFEALSLQRVIFPIVALLVSTMAVGAIRPRLFLNSDVILLKILIISLSIAGFIHLFGRFKFGIDRYTFDPSDIHNSILDGDDAPQRNLSRWLAGFLLVIGMIVSFLLGLAVGYQFEFRSLLLSDYIFADSISIEAVLYPPIFVLLADLVHSFLVSAESRKPDLTIG